MKHRSETVRPEMAPSAPAVFAILALALTAAFAMPLWQLVRYAAATHLHSHILLIPFISLYLWNISKARALPLPHSTLLPAAFACLIGVAALAGYWFFGRTGRVVQNDALALSTLSFLAFLLAAALATVGWPLLRSRLFAVSFLVFMIPLPVAVTQGLSVFLQHASAEACNITLPLVGLPVFRTDLTFQLPGLSIVVAEECSGIRSTLVLFITSVIASHLFLQTGWKRLVFILAVIPLGIFRNALRITTISWLTVNVDPGIIHGPVHHRGGPVFFVLSLIPLFVLLWLLRRSELRKPKFQRT